MASKLRSPVPEKASRREIFGWCMFDFANSSYTTLIVTFAFSVYFVEAVVGGADSRPGRGHFLWGLGYLISQGIVLLTAPIVGAMADFSGAKKKFLFLTYAGCVAGTAGLGFVGPGDVTLGLVLFVISNIFYSTGENIVAAFLPEIASDESMGRISGLGWALGYFGGLGSLFACYPFLREGLGAENAASVRLSFVVVALFFLVAGLPTFLFLRERARPQVLPRDESYFTVGFRRVVQTLAHVRRYRQLFRFLLVFFLYNCGIVIVVNFANIYAKGEIGMTVKELLIFFMIVQVSASLGAVVFGYMQDLMSSKAAILVSLIIWLGVCVGASLTHSVTAFYVIGNLAGIAMGSAQSAGRALVGTFSPVERSGEFFGFWGLVWKLSAVGPFLFGYVSDAFGSMRVAILLTSLFFVLGIAGMLFIDEEEGRRAALGAGPSQPSQGET